MKWKELSGEERYRVVQMARKGEVPIQELCKTFGVSRQTLNEAMEKVDRAAMAELIAGADPVAVETVGLRILTNKRRALRGEPWPLQPPPLCVEAADKVYGLGTSRWEEIELKTIGWEEDLLIA